MGFIRPTERIGGAIGDNDGRNESGKRRGFDRGVCGPHPARPGAAEWRRKERGVPVWAIIGTLLPDGSNADQVASDYGISYEAIEAAQAYYRQHQPLIDARLAANRAA